MMHFDSNGPGATYSNDPELDCNLNSYKHIVLGLGFTADIELLDAEGESSGNPDRVTMKNEFNKRLDIGSKASQAHYLGLSD